MKKLDSADKYLFGIATLFIALFSAFGFYLINAEPKIRSLVVSGHNHILSFAFGAILFGLLMRTLDFSVMKKKVLGVWMTLTFLGPIALIYAGISGNSSILRVTGVLFEGSFVLLWLIMAYSVFTSKVK